MTEDPIKIYLDGSTYATKVNGKLVLVRERRERLRDICMDLLGEAFGKYSRPKMKNDSKKQEGEHVEAQNFAAPPLFNPNANWAGPASVPSIMGPMGPQPGIYRFGNRQLALLPLNPQAGPAMPPQMGYTHPQPPWMFPQASNISGFNFPPMGIDPRQFITNSAAPGEVTSKTSVTVAKHVCAECGKLRSRKYQHENPLKPGETPSPSFCKKCQKDVTSTEESDTSIGNTKKQQKRSKKVLKKESEVDSDQDSSRKSIGSDKSYKVSKSKQGRTRNKQSDAFVATEGQRSKSTHRNLSTRLHGDEDYIPNRKQASQQPEKLYSRHSMSTSSPQNQDIDSPIHRSRTNNHQAQGSSREDVATDAAETFHYSRKAPSHSSYETYEADRFSKQSCSNENSVHAEATTLGRHGFDDMFISASRTRSEEASRRRRLERSNDRQESHREATRLPYGVHPSEDDEVVVVTERYVYRPRQLSHVQEEDRQSRKHVIMDKATARTDKSYLRFSTETEAANYYRNDWAGVNEQDKAGHEVVGQRDLEGLTTPTNSHTSDTSLSSRCRAKPDEHHLPRAPSLPRPLNQGGGRRAQVDLSRHGIPYPPSEDEGLPSRGNEKYTTARDQEVASHGRNRNIYRPPYAREATDMGTERAPVPSPKHSQEMLFYPDTSDSEITEEIERVERYVTFRDANGYNESYDILSGETGSARSTEKAGKAII